MNEKTFSNKAPLYLIGMCFLVYFLAYLGRYSYSSNINCVMEYFNINKASAGSVGTFFFISYGIGQVINGLLCKKYNLKYAISFAVFVSGLMNLLVGFTNESSFEMLKIYWLINGFAQSILWSSLIRALNENLPSHKLTTAIFVMGLPVSIGTFAIYGISSIISLLNISYKVIFIGASILLFVMTIVWYCFYEPIRDDISSQKENIIKTDVLKEQKTAKLSKTFVVLFSILAVFAIANNLVKDGLTTWMPTILKEKYSLGNSLSTFLTVFLPFFAVFGSTFAIFLNKKLNNFILVCGVLYSVAFLMFVFVLLTLSSEIWILPLVCFIVVACVMSGVNNVLTNIFPMLYSMENAGTIAGILDGFCYVGSAITAFGMGSIADKHGWNIVFYILLGVCAVMIIICLVYTIINNLKTKLSRQKNN